MMNNIAFGLSCSSTFSGYPAFQDYFGFFVSCFDDDGSVCRENCIPLEKLARRRVSVVINCDCKNLQVLEDDFIKMS